MLVALAVMALLGGQPAQAPSPYLDAVRHYGAGQEAQAIAALHALDLADADQVSSMLLPVLLATSLAAAAPTAAGTSPAQAPAAGSSPYLDVVSRYGPGTERDALSLLAALRLRDVDQVIQAIDGACVADGARSCQPRDLDRVAPDVAARVAGRWRRVYPRAMALHAEALVAAGAGRDAAGVAFHTGVLQRLAARCEDIAKRPDAPPAVTRLAATGPRLLVWAFQYLRDEAGLLRAIDLLRRERPDDVELWLARGAFAEFRTRPDSIAATRRQISAAMARRGGAVDQRASERERAPTDVELEGEIQRRVELAAREYREAVKKHPENAEIHLRLGRLLTLLDRTEDADRQFALAGSLQPDARQAYLLSLFLGDLREQQQRPADALAAYTAALQAWPGAQAPVVALARLRAQTGATAEARALLAGVHAERDLRERSDPWLGYVGGQGWRLPAAIAELQREAEAAR